MSTMGRSPALSSGWAPLAWLALLGLMGLAGRRRAPALGVRSEAVATSQGRAEPPSVPSARGTSGTRQGDSAPGEPKKDGVDIIAGVRGYLIGLVLAAALTVGSFILSYTNLVYGPGIYTALIVFAIAQVGIHLVFFLHLTTSPDNINNALALAFGVLIVLLVVVGTIWIMDHMNANMMTTHGGSTNGMSGMSMP